MNNNNGILSGGGLLLTNGTNVNSMNGLLTSSDGLSYSQTGKRVGFNNSGYQDVGPNYNASASMKMSHQPNLVNQ